MLVPMALLRTQSIQLRSGLKRNVYSVTLKLVFCSATEIPPNQTS